MEAEQAPLCHGEMTGYCLSPLLSDLYALL